MNVAVRGTRSVVLDVDLPCEWSAPEAEKGGHGGFPFRRAVWRSMHSRYYVRELRLRRVFCRLPRV